MTNLNAIDTFLADYKVRMMTYYTELRDKYYSLDRAICDAWNSGNRDEARALRVDMENFHKVHGATNIAVIRHHFRDLESVVDKDLANRKVAFIKRITDKVGDVESADLHIGEDGSINGTVEGAEGKAKVSSIIAGGYNIQKAHYRVLVKAA